MSQSNPKRGASQWAVAWRRFRRNKSGLLGSAIVVFFILVALVGPFVVAYPARSYRSLYEGDAGSPPSFKHPFGVEDSGIDVFSETINAAHNDLYVGLAATLITTLIGVAVGALAGYFKGAVSDVLLGLIQMFFVIPVLLLILLFARVFSVLVFKGLGLTLIVLILAFFGWSSIAFIVRGETFRLKEMEFVQAARSLGAGSYRLLFRHIVPNILSPVIVIATLNIAGFILTEVVVSFLGFGDPNTSTWGLLLNEGFPYVRTSWWVSLFPGLAVVFCVLGFNLMGDGLSDALNPRLRE
ncbi:MAG TPA: ABC transporter permease [Candidatus Dormibacteraeota bacterium]|nr:ABC transporter permease [Candidatus Dormibacteraeota bacterium]